MVQNENLLFCCTVFQTAVIFNNGIIFSDLIGAIQQWKRQLKLSIVGVSNRGSRRTEVWSYFGQELVVGDVWVFVTSPNGTLRESPPPITPNRPLSTTDPVEGGLRRFSRQNWTFHTCVGSYNSFGSTCGIPRKHFIHFWGWIPTKCLTKLYPRCFEDVYESLII